VLATIELITLILHYTQTNHIANIAFQPKFSFLSQTFL